MNREELHQRHVEKKREERWKTKFANAKMEDVGAVLIEVERSHQELMGANLIMRRALIMKGLLTDEDLTAAYEFEKNRLEEAAKKQFEEANALKSAQEGGVGE